MSENEPPQLGVDRIVMPLTVAAARSNGVCRVCGEPIRVSGSPKGWQFEFREMIFPMAVTLNFGHEFAHTQCLAGKQA